MNEFTGTVSFIDQLEPKNDLDWATFGCSCGFRPGKHCDPATGKLDFPTLRDITDEARLPNGHLFTEAEPIKGVPTILRVYQGEGYYWLVSMYEGEPILLYGSQLC